MKWLVFAVLGVSSVWHIISFRICTPSAPGFSRHFAASVIGLLAEGVVVALPPFSLAEWKSKASIAYTYRMLVRLDTKDSDRWVIIFMKTISRRILRGVLPTTVAGLAMFALVSDAHALSVGYINASGGDLNYLIGFGHTVSYVNDPTGLTLADLSAFDVVVATSNGIFNEPENIGNVLAEFADSGRGVVLTEFVFQGQWALSGDIMDAGYSPFTIDPLSSGYGISSSLGTVYDPTSPLLTGAGGAQTQFQANVGLNAGSELVADWDSGRRAVAFTQLSQSAVVGLNLFPDDTYIDGDTHRLVANAVEFSLNDAPSSVPDSGPGILGLGTLLSLFAFFHPKMRSQTAE